MTFSTHTTRQLVQTIATALVVAGLAVPAAEAGSGQLTDVFSRAVARHQAQALTDVFERYVASHPYGAGLAPNALPAGEPKNQRPFTRSAIERSPAQVAATRRASQGFLIQGERKNQLPFTRAAISSSAASGFSPSTGEAKNQAPFARSATGQQQSIVARASNGFQWGDAAIGAVAAIALALVGAAMFARTMRTHESSPAH